jgi:hypothetical protein
MAQQIRNAASERGLRVSLVENLDGILVIVTERDRVEVGGTV